MEKEKKGTGSTGANVLVAVAAGRGAATHVTDGQRVTFHVKVVWMAPDCASLGTGGVTVTDEQGSSVSRSLSVSLNRCPAIAVAGGHRHSVALLADGTVWTWGDNTHGQIGDETLVWSVVPVQVSLP